MPYSTRDDKQAGPVKETLGLHFIVLVNSEQSTSIFCIHRATIVVFWCNFNAIQKVGNLPRRFSNDSYFWVSPRRFSVLVTSKLGMKEKNRLS